MKYYYKYEKKQLKREDNTSLLKDSIAQMWQKYKLQDKLTEIDIKNMWFSLFGEKIKEKVEKISLYRHKLFVKLNSPALKQDLMMQKTDMLQKITQHCPQAKIEEIVFL